MNKDLQSKVRVFSLECVLFIDAFCRRNLSEEELNVINDIFDIAVVSLNPPSHRSVLIRNLLRKTPQIVTSAPSNVGTLTSPQSESKSFRHR
jgi:hypothetical protein